MELFRFEWKNPFTGNTVERTRLFIPSKVSDNKYLDESYVASLHQVGSAELVRAWLDGDWSVVEGSFFDCWSMRNASSLSLFPKAGCASAQWTGVAVRRFRSAGGPL